LGVLSRSFIKKKTTKIQLTFNVIGIIYNMERYYIPKEGVPETPPKRNPEVYKAKSVLDILESADFIIAERHPEYAQFLKQNPDANIEEKPPYKAQAYIYLANAWHDPSDDPKEASDILVIHDSTGYLEVRTKRTLGSISAAIQFGNLNINFEDLKNDLWYGQAYIKSHFSTIPGENNHLLVGCRRQWRGQEVRPDPWWKRFGLSESQPIPTPI
jgi:hypothetical protein